MLDYASVLSVTLVVEYVLRIMLFCEINLLSFSPLIKTLVTVALVHTTDRRQLLIINYSSDKLVMVHERLHHSDYSL